MIRLFTTAYESACPDRAREMRDCLERNLALPCLEAIHVLVEGNPGFPESHPKIQRRSITHRPSLRAYLDWINETASPDDISIIANADIHFEANIRLADDLLTRDQCWALARWDDRGAEEPVLFDRNDSQDAWVFRGPIMPMTGDFPMGVARCDNRLLFELMHVGYRVANPAFAIRARHLHDAPFREYAETHQPGYVAPPYRYLWPHNLWSLPRTWWHNRRRPDEAIAWRRDPRQWQRSLPGRIMRRVSRLVPAAKRTKATPRETA